MPYQRKPKITMAFSKASNIRLQRTVVLFCTARVMKDKQSVISNESDFN
jgi:hypothetical protein